MDINPQIILKASEKSLPLKRANFEAFEMLSMAEVLCARKAPSGDLLHILWAREASLNMNLKLWSNYIGIERDEDMWYKTVKCTPNEG